MIAEAEGNAGHVLQQNPLGEGQSILFGLGSVVQLGVFVISAYLGVDCDDLFTVSISLMLQNHFLHHIKIEKASVLVM